MPNDRHITILAASVALATVFVFFVLVGALDKNGWLDPVLDFLKLP